MQGYGLRVAGFTVTGFEKIGGWLILADFHLLSGFQIKKFN